jgi:anti-sigma B factor antagonist
VTESDRKVALNVVGELDLESADTLNRSITELHLPEITTIVLDLRQVDFIDSQGLRALLAVRDDAMRNGHALALIPPATTARRVFEITGTWDLFNWRRDHSVEPPGHGCRTEPGR